MLIARLIKTAPRMSAISVPLLFFMALLASPPLSADSLVPSSTAETHDHQTPGRDSGAGRRPEHGSHDDEETGGGELAAESDHGDHHQDDDLRHGRAARTEPSGADHPYHEEAEDHEDHEGHGHGEGTAVQLSPQQRETLNLEITALEPRTLGTRFRVPGEVRLNAYATALVTPRIDAQVLARHAQLGDQVAAGQALVTLSSVALALAQGDLVVAELEWKRRAKLKDQFVSDTEYLAASVTRQKALSSVLAYGMTPDQVESLIAASDKADGTFELLAPGSGTVVRDDFVVGEFIEAGRVLFEITDESVRWVEARMPPEQAALVSVGDQARIAYRDAWFDGRVTQIHHLLDEATRTQAVRVEVPDPEHRLHPGVFVDVDILVGAGSPVLAVPEAAILRRPDGDWQLFVAEDDDRFVPAEVHLLRTAGGLAVIDGVPAGTRVVTNGAFFLQSELAKGGFDPHNH